MPGQRAVFLFDEFDSIGSHRNQGHDVGEIKRVLNSFLINIEKDKSNSIIIAATNLPEALDRALFRRFDDVIEYPLPAIPEIAATIENYTKGYSFDKRGSFVHVAKEIVGLNYSDIARACEETIKNKILSNAPKLERSYLINRLKARI
jgi:SpoVK/Ycf46/Vps4 family AAA+-type ATPase